MIKFLIQIGPKEIIMTIGLVLILVLFVLHLSSSSSRKIKLSKKVISRVLNTSIKGKHYVIENIALVTSDGKTYNVDNVLINRNGVYIFESKVYSGCLYIQGNENDETWTKVYENKAKNQIIPNPIKETAEYKEILYNVIPKEIGIYGYIVLLANTINDSDSNNIIYSYNIERIANEDKGINLSDDTIDEIYNKIMNYVSKKEEK